MKKTVLLLCANILFANIYGQNQDYNSKMAKNILLIETAKTVSDFQILANTFAVISDSDKNEWLPLYYAAQATILRAQVETDDDKTDIYLDQAQKYLDQAMNLKSDESELIVLQGFLHQSRIKVSPMSRGQKYSTMAYELFEKAKTLNSENPRIYFLEAMNVMNTPKMFGGGNKNALPLFQKADEKFKNFVPLTPISPNWGNENNQEQLSLCIK